MTNTFPPFPIRALQLDLARSPETLDTIRLVILFMRKYGFNTLFLYLEWRVRTPSFHELPPSLSYGAEEIAEIVSFASENGIDVIPGLALFGHADILFGTGAHLEYAEIRKGDPSRFGTCGTPHVFCPSNPEALEFLKRYIGEVAALFPGKHLHAGFDEAWEIGLCPRCRKRAEAPGGQSSIFAEHLRFIHNCVTENGKTMIIWDDLFDLYPDALEKTPRDIILSAWHYDYLIEKPFGHAGGPREDHFKRYARMGFNSWMAPSASSFRNIETFTEYAERHQNVSGALLTIWEHYGAEYLPAIAYAGRLWYEGHTTTPEDILREITPFRKEAHLALGTLFLDEVLAYPPLPPGAFLRGHLNEREHHMERLVRALSNVLEEEPCFRENETLYELSLHLELQKIYFELRGILPELYNPKADVADFTATLSALARRARVALEKRKAIELRHRPDRPCRHRLEYLTLFAEAIEKLPHQAPACEAVLRVRYHFDNTPLSFFLRYEGAEEFFPVPATVFGEFRFPGEHLVDTPFELQKGLGEPCALRIDQVNSYVANTVMYAEVETRSTLFVPDSILDLQGRIASPEAILKDGRDFTILGDGEQHARRKFNSPSMTKACHSITIRLRKE